MIMKLKQFLKTFAILFALLLGSSPTWGQSFSGSGSGTESDPYLIYNPNHLNDVHNFIGQSGVVFKLMQNIDLSSWLADNNPTNGWLPIGTETQPFKGKFLGNNKTISGLFITRASTNYVGFFGYTEGATISNLTINGTTVKGADRTGGLCGIAFNSTITSCNVSMNVTGASDVGGFTGNIEGCVIKNSGYNGTVNGGGSVAGFSGYARTSTLTNITCSSSVTATSGSSGQCVGYIGSGNMTLTNIQVTGNINGESIIGGIVGKLKYGCDLTISNSSVNGNITGTSYLGGIVGSSDGTLTITECFSRGNINGTTHMGGIIGASNSYFSINGSAHTGDITSTNNSSTCYIGGIIGYTYPNSNIYTTDIDNNSFSSYKNIVNNSYSVGSISSSGDCIGGIIGYQESNNEKLILTTIDMSNYKVLSHAGSWTAIAPTIMNNYFFVYKFYNVDAYLYTKTNLTSTSDQFLKKLLDLGVISRYIEQINYPYFSPAGSSLSEVTVNFVLDSQISLTEISNSYHSGDIYGNSKVGGIIGYGKSANINTSYSSGKIYANNYVGGITGYLESNANAVGNSEISSCVSANEVIVGTGGNTGRIFGAVGDNVTIGATGTTSANKGLASAKVTSAGTTVSFDDGPQHGTNVGASTLRLKSNYVGMGWDFDNYWKIQETECYPYKATQCAPPKITSQLISGATSVSGQSIDGGTVVLFTGNESYTAAVSGNQWTVNITEGLQSGDIIKVCATKTGLMQSYFTIGTVDFIGGGTEDDPFLIYTASDLANINSYSYYKIMNDINVSGWITANSPTTGWVPVGMNSGISMKQLDGNGKTISGLWTNSTTNFYGLISTANDATIKDLTINLSKNSKVGAYSAILVGKADNSTFTNININGNINGGDRLGGIVGSGSGNSFENCKVVSNITSSGSAGGLCGYSVSGSFINCQYNGSLAGVNFVGGISGGNNTSNSFTLCQVAGSITGSRYAGGITPACSETINKCITDATIVGEDFVGGIVGSNYTTSSLITESYSNGTITATATENNNCYAGGIAGENNGTISNSYSTVEVTSVEYGAGVSGINYGTVDRCHASGNVYAEKWGAGIVAYNDGSAANVTRCFAANNKIQVSEAGGIGMRMIGGFRNGASEPDNTNYALNSMEVSINNIPKTVYDDPLEGISVTQAQLYTQATYVNNGWDFTDIWGIEEGVGYPYLLALVEEPTQPFAPGDVNDDGTIDVADYVDVASYILEQDPQPFNFAAADLDEDNTIDVGDLVGVAYLALNYEGKAECIMHNAQCIMHDNEECTMGAVVQGKEVIINLSNNVDITAMQMDINLPQGMTLVDATLSDRASASHQVQFRELNSGGYRLLAASSALKSFKNNDGTVLTLTLAGEPSGNGSLSGIKLASPSVTCYGIGDIELSFSPTGVDNVTTEARIYNEGNNIVIVSPNDGEAQLALPNGMYKTVRVDAGRNVYPAPATGLVIVKMGNEVKKMRF